MQKASVKKNVVKLKHTQNRHVKRLCEFTKIQIQSPNEIQSGVTAIVSSKQHQFFSVHFYKVKGFVGILSGV